MAQARAPKRGEICLVDFDPSIGAEIRKARPSVVVSLENIGRLPLRIVIPITDWKSVYANYPWFVELPATPNNGLIKGSGADTFQIKSVSEDRFVRHLGSVSPDQLDEIVEAIALCIGVP